MLFSHPFTSRYTYTDNRTGVTYHLNRVLRASKRDRSPFFIAIPAGIARMSVWKFALFTFVGALPWTFGLALGGFLLGANYENIRSATRPFDIPIILTILGLTGWFVWHRVREIRSDSREAAPGSTSLNTDE